MAENEDLITLASTAIERAIKAGTHPPAWVKWAKQWVSGVNRHHSTTSYALWLQGISFACECACRAAQAAVEGKADECKKWVEQCLHASANEARDSAGRFRTLIKIESVEGDIATCFIPSWEWRERVRVKVSTLPESFHAKLVMGARAYARVNLEARRASELNIDNWEFPKPRRK
jgi:hypothetical protein